MNNFIKVNENNIEKNYCCVIAGGKTLESNTFTRRYYQGVDTVRIDTFCPNMTELKKMFPNSQNIQEPVYVGTADVDGKTVPNVRIDVYTFNAMYGLSTRFSIFLTKAGVKGSTSGKIQVIDVYGRTAWVTPEELAEHKIPVYSNGPADIDKDYRPCYRGEVELTKLVKCMLGVDDTREYSAEKGRYVTIQDKERLQDCQCRFELSDLDDMFKGKFNLLKSYANYPTKNDVKVMFGVRTANNGSVYQDICSSEFMKMNSRGTYDFDQLLKSRDFKNVEYSTEPLHEYSVEPTSVVAEVPVQQPTAEATFDPMSDMPF